MSSNPVPSAGWGAKAFPCPKAHPREATWWLSSRWPSQTESHHSPERSSSTAWPSASRVTVTSSQTQPCPRCYHNQITTSYCVWKRQAALKRVVDHVQLFARRWLSAGARHDAHQLSDAVRAVSWELINGGLWYLRASIDSIAFLLNELSVLLYLQTFRRISVCYSSLYRLP